MLKGEIVALYDDKLEFDSDELNTLFIDWEDVKLLKSNSIVSVGFTDLSTRTGQLLIKNGKTYINGVEFDSRSIMTIIAGELTESNYWSSKISLGANFRKGNTDQIDYSTLAKSKRRTTESRFNIDYIGNYSETDGESQINNHRINSNFDWFISKQFYLRPVFGEVYIDPFLNTDYRITIGSGLGYSIIDNNKTEWSVSGGPAYTYTRFDTVEVTEAKGDTSAALVIENIYSTEISDDIDFNALYRLQYGNEESGGYTHHAIATLEIELTDMFDLDLSIVWDRTTTPQPDSEGFTPQKDDYQFIIGFGIDL